MLRDSEIVLVPTVTNMSTAHSLLSRPLGLMSERGPASAFAGAGLPGAMVKSPPSNIAAATMAGSSISHGGPDLTQMKLALYEGVGRELGVDISEFQDVSEYSRALKAVVGEIRQQPNGQRMIDLIEHKLGLDKLGISLDGLIASLTEPASEEKLTSALLATLGDAEMRLVRITTDDAGTYSVMRARA